MRDFEKTTFRADPAALGCALAFMHPLSAGVYMKLLLIAWSDDDCLVRRVDGVRKNAFREINKRSWDTTVWPDISEHFEIVPDGWLFGYDSTSSRHAQWKYHRSRIMDDRWAEIRATVLREDDNVCVYCGCDRGPFEVDHDIPRSRGGTHDRGNLVVACFSCNRSKRAMTGAEFVDHLRGEIPAP